MITDGKSKITSLNGTQDTPTESLEAKVKRLEAHVTQLQNILAKSKSGKKKVKRNTKPFNFAKHSKRHVLLKFAYLGWDRNGYAVQEDTDNTIESALFDCLLQTKLIESRDTSNYHRCGRTDKGVSAYSQVISITLRSCKEYGLGIEKPVEGSEHIQSNAASEETLDDLKSELSYPSLLNKVLPVDIRVLAWCPVAKGFSARFDCIGRTYKYFFPKGDLNMKNMEIASKRLLGEHDFRNLCKMDVGNGVIKYHRRIDSIQFSVFETANEPGNQRCTNEQYDMMVATIKGKAFLWHQIRAIMTVLFLVGEGKEEPDIISKLLDIEKLPRKPQYGLASEVPLNLYSTDYEGIEWIADAENVLYVKKQFQCLWTQNAVRASMLKSMTLDLSLLCPKISCTSFAQSLTMDFHTRAHKPLLERLTAKGLDEQIEHFRKRRRLNPDVIEDQPSNMTNKL